MQEWPEPLLKDPVWQQCIQLMVYALPRVAEASLGVVQLARELRPLLVALLSGNCILRPFWLTAGGSRRQPTVNHALTAPSISDSDLWFHRGASLRVANSSYLKGGSPSMQAPLCGSHLLQQPAAFALLP